MAIWGRFWRFESRSTRVDRTAAALKSLVAAADHPHQSDTSLFVSSALRAAKGTQPSYRRAILKDVANLLSCHGEDIDFLFNAPVLAANDSDPVEMPDYRASLKRERQAAIR